MLRKASDFVTFIQHHIGRVPATGHNLYDDLNVAGDTLFTAHDWPWRLAGPVEMPVVNGQQFIELPPDYAMQTESWIEDIGPLYNLEPVTLREYALLRQAEVFGYVAGRLYIYWPHWETDSVEDEPKPRALVYPTPTVDGLPTIHLIYKKRWVDIADTDTDAVPNVPPAWRLALAYKASAIAWQREFDQESGNAIRYDIEIERLKAEAGKDPGRFGKMVGGASARLAAKRQGSGSYGDTRYGIASI